VSVFINRCADIVRTIVISNSTWPQKISENKRSNVLRNVPNESLFTRCINGYFWSVKPSLRAISCKTEIHDETRGKVVE